MSSTSWRRVAAAFALAMSVAALFASSALAATPAPGYGQFAGCPSPEENPNSGLCLKTVITGGNFKMGSKNVPIKNPMTLTGALDTSNGNFIYNSEGGLSPVKQKVPGGVVGLTGLTWLLEVLGSEALTLYAVTELAGTPKELLSESASLPIKVHLINPVLGNNCYVGSNSNPINLQLATGTTNPPPPNEPITGREPEQTFDGVHSIFHFTNGEYVDNSFSAPGASGCVLTLFGFIPISINSLVDGQAGLPAAAGTNEARQTFEAEAAPTHLVYP